VSTHPLRKVHKAGLRVLKATSALIRIQILGLLEERGPMSYTEIMNALKLNATRDAGRFAYHLKSLSRADLIEPNVETKNYQLTDLGHRIIRITDEIEDITSKRKRVFVRTSHFSIEEFDRNKITRSLVTEANIPTDLAQKVAKETERRLQRTKTKYLTAPLIREIVNTILLEKHYEDYRHKLTRLGLPVHEVTRLVNAHGREVNTIHRTAGNVVFEEYTLLNFLPREISDAYLDGDLHLNNLGTWILKPNEIIHSLPYLLQLYRPKTFEAALNMTTNIIKKTASEIIGHQSLDNFNVHFAPYLKNVNPSKVKKRLRLFLDNLNQLTFAPTTLNIEISEEKTGSHPTEAQQLATFLFETLATENEDHSLKNPKVLVKIRRETLRSNFTETILLEAHKLAGESAILYFVNQCHDDQENATYTGSGLRLADDWTNDWEIDTQRTGNLDTVAINLPRIAIDARGDEDMLKELLEDKLDLACQALEKKHQMIERRIKLNQLPYLGQQTDDGGYYRLQHTTRAILPIGLAEYVKAMMENKESENHHKTVVCTKNVLEHIRAYLKKRTKKPSTRLVTTIIPNQHATDRLGKLDVEKYGWGIVPVRNKKEQPYYSDVNIVSIHQHEQIIMEEQIHQLTPGGHITFIKPDAKDQVPEDFLAKTIQLANSNIRLFAYTQADRVTTL
jgi:ribonucleoside-triphosphate reductase